ncbi:MAG: molybdopterin-dependent oxidoreductase [bacterium]
MDEAQKIKCTIDGKEIAVLKGTLIIDAAKEAGIYIPRFCSHKLLKPYAGCRMCLVDILKESESNPRPNPKPQPSCALPVLDGMVVETDSDRIRKIRKAILEFTLINHPLDCPVCDKGGECDLQDLSYLYGPEDSRFRETKLFENHRNLSSLIVLDYNRCILCKRCVRWTKEVADDDRLIFTKRGAHTQISAYNDMPFASRFGGMTIELCPVGALTSNVFRFKARSWEVGNVDSVCTECALGCSMVGQFRRERIMRFLSREDEKVNGPYFCDRGRFAHDRIEHPDRLVKPLLRREGKFVPIGWDEAAEITAENFKRIASDFGPRAIALCADPAQSLESLHALKKLFRTGLGSPRIEHAPAPLGLDPDDLSGLLGRLSSFDSALKSKHLVLWNSEPFDEMPVFGLRLKLATEKNEIDGISVTPVGTYLGRKGFSEFVAPQHRMRKILAAIISLLAKRSAGIPNELKEPVDAAFNAVSDLSQAEGEIARSAFENLVSDDAVLVIGHSPLRFRPLDITSLLLLAQLRETVTGKHLPILPIFRHANSLGALILGFRTELLHGKAQAGRIGFTGESVLTWPEEIEKGQLKAIFSIGDGLIDELGRKGLKAVASLDFFVTATEFMNPLAARADIILPTLTPWEQSGTYINPGGDIGRSKAIVPEAGGIWTLERFAREVGANLKSGEAESVDERNSFLSDSHTALKSISNTEADRIERVPLMPFRLGNAKHAFSPVEQPSGGRFSLVLTESVFRHDSPGIHAEHIMGIGEEFLMGISGRDAKRLGINTGDKVRLMGGLGGAGSIEARAQIIDIPQGYILAPEGYTDKPLSDLDFLADPDVKIGVGKIESTHE